MKIFVLNCGSSTVKFQLLNMKDEMVLGKGLADCIGTNDAVFTFKGLSSNSTTQQRDLPDHQFAISLAINALSEDSERKELFIDAVGHRIVHGGERFKNPVKISKSIIQDIKNCIPLAPLHNPHNLKGIEICLSLLPGTPQVAVFDTAFHQNIPPKAYLYALPYRFYTQHRIRRFGFHGTSHQYVAEETAQMLNTPLTALKLITCHLGNGASIAAIKDGRSVDTSMGFTPLEGIVMGTRSGDIDPAIPGIMQKVEDLSADEVSDLLNKESGLLGLSGVSKDMREIEHVSEKGNERASAAIEVFCYRIRKYIGAYFAVLNGVDAIIFTGGIGENSSLIRAKILNGMDKLGIKLNEELNHKNHRMIHDGPIPILVIQTNEELMIARETASILKRTMQKNHITGDSPFSDDFKT